MTILMTYVIAVKSNQLDSGGSGGPGYPLSEHHFGCHWSSSPDPLSSSGLFRHQELGVLYAWDGYGLSQIENVLSALNNGTRNML